MIVYREKESGKVAAIFSGCETQSPVFNNPENYTKEETEQVLEIDSSLVQPSQTESLDDRIRRIAREEIGGG